ncbi:hypothetical protein BJ912DRAFT_1010023 [Pholiota molesta]|nr:hypothetical protein BJ912DRAFT_1010023 [Pholiota molesta]
MTITFGIAPLVFISSWNTSCSESLVRIRIACFRVAQFLFSSCSRIFLETKDVMSLWYSSLVRRSESATLFSGSSHSCTSRPSSWTTSSFHIFTSSLQSFSVSTLPFSTANFVSTKICLGEPASISINIAKPSAHTFFKLSSP